MDIRRFFKREERELVVEDARLVDSVLVTSPESQLVRVLAGDSINLKYEFKLDFIAPKDGVLDVATLRRSIAPLLAEKAYDFIKKEL